MLGRAGADEATEVHGHVDFFAKVISLAFELFAQARILGQRSAQLALDTLDVAESAGLAQLDAGTGLVDQIVWVRKLSHVFGTSALAEACRRRGCTGPRTLGCRILRF